MVHAGAGTAFERADVDVAWLAKHRVPWRGLRTLAELGNTKVIVVGGLVACWPT